MTAKITVLMQLDGLSDSRVQEVAKRMQRSVQRAAKGTWEKESAWFGEDAVTDMVVVMEESSS